MLDTAIEKALRDSVGCDTIQMAPYSSASALNETRVYETDNGMYFVKLNDNLDISMYEAEAKGLGALAQTATVRVPKAYYYGQHEGTAFLILEYIPMSPHSKKSQAELGIQIGKLHLTRTPWEFGFDFDNTIGTTPQVNKWTKDWVNFFGTYRLRYQCKLLEKNYGDSEICAKGEKLIKRLPIFFSGIKVSASLLHGDLWYGNTSADKSGDPVVFDPAPYFGHDEAELSIMGMFGGFLPEFYEAYHDLIPRREGFDERQKIYQLYHYLNHYNIFGSGYRPSCLSILQDLL